MVKEGKKETVGKMSDTRRFEDGGIDHMNESK